MKRLPLPLSAVALATGLLASGCLNLKPTADPTRYFVLASAPSGPRVDSLGDEVSVGLRPVRLAKYLSNDRLAVRHGANEIEYLEWLRWAERLEAGLLRVLGSNLRESLQTDRIYFSDWSREEVRFEVDLSVTRFEPDPEGLVTLEVDWRITRPGSRELLRTGVSRLQEQGAAISEDPSEAVGVMGALLGEFSQELAETLRELSVGRNIE